MGFCGNQETAGACFAVADPTGALGVLAVYVNGVRMNVSTTSFKPGDKVHIRGSLYWTTACLALEPRAECQHSTINTCPEFSTGTDSTWELDPTSICPYGNGTGACQVNLYDDVRANTVGIACNGSDGSFDIEYTCPDVNRLVTVRTRVFDHADSPQANIVDASVTFRVSSTPPDPCANCPCDSCCDDCDSCCPPLPNCAPGFLWDTNLEDCVPVPLPPTCPPGQLYDTTLETCVTPPGGPSCSSGLYDSSRETCVDCDFTRQYYDPMVGECKAFNVPPACPKQSGSAFPLIALAAAAVVGLVLMAQKRDR